MKRRRHQGGKRKPDPVEAVVEEALKSGKYVPFYCAKHGQHYFLPGFRPDCPECGAACFNEDEWQYRGSARNRRERRVQLLRNHLE